MTGGLAILARVCSLAHCPPGVAYGINPNTIIFEPMDPEYMEWFYKGERVMPIDPPLETQAWWNSPTSPLRNASFKILDYM